MRKHIFAVTDVEGTYYLLASNREAAREWIHKHTGMPYAWIEKHVWVRKVIWRKEKRPDAVEIEGEAE